MSPLDFSMPSKYRLAIRTSSRTRQALRDWQYLGPRRIESRGVIEFANLRWPTPNHELFDLADELRLVLQSYAEQHAVAVFLRGAVKRHLRCGRVSDDETGG